MSSVADIDKALRAAGLPIAGISESTLAVANATFHRLSDGEQRRVDWPAPPTAQQIASADAIVQAHDGTPPTTHQQAVSLAADSQVPQVVVRAGFRVTMDEVNLIREWITSFKAAVAAASSLADLKTRIAALDNLPQRTVAQAKQAIVDKINSNGAD